MPRMPMRGQPQRAPAASGARQVWTLRAGQPVAIDVRTGASDGVDTEITAGNLEPGTPLIVDATTAGS
jgi:HlyD family secretion protein